jgi:hypothetical protein
MFQNICVVPRTPTKEHPQEVEFIYISKSNNTIAVDPKEMEFTLGVAYHSVDNRVLFTPTVMTRAEFQQTYATNSNGIQYIHGLSTIVYEFNSENFGHMLTDVLMPMYVALDTFSMTERKDLQFFRLYIHEAIGWSCDLQKTTTNGVVDPTQAAKNCDRMYQLFSQLTPGHEPLQVLNATSMSPTCFQSALVGMTHFGDDCNTKGDHGRKQDYWSLCNVARQGQFWNFRNWMLRNAGVSMAPPTRHRITITKGRGGRIHRMLANMDTFIESTKRQHPEVEVVVAEWETMSIQEQLELIRTTTVHVTPPGGVSFIAMFLPRWATSIRLYRSDYLMEWHLFHYLGYMTVEHVDCREGHGHIPVDEAMALIERSLRRYETFRKTQDPNGWT